MPVSSLPWRISRVNTSTQLLMVGSSPDSSIGSVPRSVELKFSPCSACQRRRRNAISPEMAIALSMMVEMTSFTPRVTFRTPATPA